MDNQLQYKISAIRHKVWIPAQFIAVCVFAFVAAALATVYFCRSMNSGMHMPGDWTMSMMWMQMPGETWFASSLNFLLMWLAMMMAMMMPSALPMFLKTRRQWVSLCYMASGYFAIWLIAGVGIYIVGMALAMATMQHESFSRAVPVLSGALLIAAGATQFTRWKLTHLLRCRSSFGCTISCSEHEKSFLIGCKQGAACCICCTTLMTIQLVIGIMNPFAMIVVAIAIAAEKLLPRPEITARVVGIVAIFAGIIITIH